MKLPRDLSGADLVKALARFGYPVTRQTGNHIRLTTDTPAPHHITIPAHDPPPTAPARPAHRHPP